MLIWPHTALVMVSQVCKLHILIRLRSNTSCFSLEQMQSILARRRGATEFEESQRAAGRRDGRLKNQEADRSFNTEYANSSAESSARSGLSERSSWMSSDDGVFLSNEQIRILSATSFSSRFKTRLIKERSICFITQWTISDKKRKARGRTTSNYGCRNLDRIDFRPSSASSLFLHIEFFSSLLLCAQMEAEPDC